MEPFQYVATYLLHANVTSETIIFPNPKPNPKKIILFWLYSSSVLGLGTIDSTLNLTQWTVSFTFVCDLAT